MLEVDFLVICVIFRRILHLRSGSTDELLDGMAQEYIFILENVKAAHRGTHGALIIESRVMIDRTGSSTSVNGAESLRIRSPS